MKEACAGSCGGCHAANGEHAAADAASSKAGDEAAGVAGAADAENIGGGVVGTERYPRGLADGGTAATSMLLQSAEGGMPEGAVYRGAVEEQRPLSATPTTGTQIAQRRLRDEEGWFSLNTGGGAGAAQLGLLAVGPCAALCVWAWSRWWRVRRTRPFGGAKSAALSV